MPQIIEDLGNGVVGPIALTPADVDIAVDLHQAEGVARLGCAVGRVRGQDMPGPGIGGKCVGVEDVHRLSRVQSATTHNVETERKSCILIAQNIS